MLELKLIHVSKTHARGKTIDRFYLHIVFIMFDFWIYVILLIG